MRLARWSRQQQQHLVPPWAPPAFLCPALASGAASMQIQWQNPSFQHRRPKAERHGLYRRSQQRSMHIESAREPVNRNVTALPTASGLPLTCPGCGAYSQTQSPEEAGFYGKRRTDVLLRTPRLSELDEHADEERTAVKTVSSSKKEQQLPVCDRCHRLKHHSEGVPIFHPDISSIQDILDESPHKRNHIFHVVDAVDFPMSIVPRAHELLDAIQRGRNRRAKNERHLREGKPTMSFIITRADLLAPTKEQTQSMLADLRTILVQALGRHFRDVRIQIKFVSAMRGWWTKSLKEEIQKMDGACWLLGKVNVGKSSLLETIFPKGTIEKRELKFHGGVVAEPSDQGTVHKLAERPLVRQEDSRIKTEYAVSTADQLNFSLPPAAPETAFPIMPTISHLPGTTAQPIRLRFGNGRGELIDLPGLDRKDMASFVLPAKQSMLVMQRRVKPEQQTIKPGQSLMIGDLVRITPTWPKWTEVIEKRQACEHIGDVPVMMAAVFVPFKSHITSTEKAIDHQAQERHVHAGFEQLLAPGAGAQISSAGLFRLGWDVTSKRSGPLTRADAVGFKSSQLPFIVCSTDIVLEGIGWVELSFQLRRRQVEEMCGKSELVDTANLPEHIAPSVEIFSPNGKHVMARMPLNTFMVGGRTKKIKTKRPMKGMSGAKRTFKREVRARALRVAGESTW